MSWPSDRENKLSPEKKSNEFLLWIKKENAKIKCWIVLNDRADLYVPLQLKVKILKGNRESEDLETRSERLAVAINIYESMEQRAVRFPWRFDNFESITQFDTVPLERAEANNFFFYISLYLFSFIFNAKLNLSPFTRHTVQPIVLIVAPAFVGRDVSPEDSGLRIDRTTLSFPPDYPRSMLDLRVTSGRSFKLFKPTSSSFEPVI